MDADFSLETQIEKQGTPVGVLSLLSLSPARFAKNYFYAGTTDPVHCLRVELEYGGARILPGHRSLFVGEGARKVRRDRDAEKTLLALLDLPQLQKLTKVYHWIDASDPRSHWKTCASQQEWLTFVEQMPILLEPQGWRIEMDPSFELAVHSPDSWYVDLEETAGGTFAAKVGFELSNRRINILPFLLERLRGGKPLDFLLLDDGRRVVIPRERIELLTASLLELFDKEAVTGDGGSIEIPWVRAMELAKFQALEDFKSKLPVALKEKAERLALVTAAPKVRKPRTLKAELRDYQREGLNWLQLLREAGFGAVLADDMGLGKTVQALAHILVEKSAGRVDAPCLIVAPTSVLYNWEAETKKFAPSLNILVSHGSDRADHFEDFAKYDLIVTSYPLLARDGEELLKHRFHLLILDEAQFIRNHRTIAARVVRLFDAHQRIALTGTPLENNLDELWSLFSFVMPGLLGSHGVFRKLFRVPIEKAGHPVARRVLARRIAPFVLRRTKDEVATELPPKTEMIQRIELTVAQKELYETVRAASEDQVREAVKIKGLARSHIIVLDALLKMRQVCCHPQLLKLEAAKGVVESAKLDALREMLNEMIPEGRRVLIFSQFTSMLKLIEAMLNEQGVDFVKITGSTKDRKTPVADFQASKIPVFLISLKAGGTGLNLTAADTVIHFDPWWNPAAESQATDRAYRIGQDKPVFVYKFIASGTVEETILAMQEKKKDLIGGLLDDQKEALSKWGEEDLMDLFKPLGQGA
ncbi:DEAD/DEAH box helicase [Pontiellaceae bacterium B1224]|nr:DEAD/DEAH box helicase [Pontiellaceae bacterium B1224]